MATHSRDRLVVTALALSPRPPAPGAGGRERERSEVPAPLVALADRTTRTVAVLAVSRLTPPSSTTPPHVSGGIANGVDGRGGDGGGEEGTGGAVGHLHLLSVWPCREKVTALVGAAASEMVKANLVDRGGDEHKADSRGENQEHQQLRRHQHPRQHIANVALGFAGGMFLMGTTKGVVWTVGVETPNSPMASPGSPARADEGLDTSIAS